MSRKTIEIGDTRTQVFIRDRGRCRVCGRPQPLTQGTCAHLVSQSEGHVAQYGATVIHDPDNMVWTCPGRCNDLASVNNHPVLVQVLTAHIRRKLLDGKRFDQADLLRRFCPQKFAKSGERLYIHSEK